jgi:hypothetical protein
VLLQPASMAWIPRLTGAVLISPKERMESALDNQRQPETPETNGSRAAPDTQRAAEKPLITWGRSGGPPKSHP